MGDSEEAGGFTVRSDLGMPFFDRTGLVRLVVLSCWLRLPDLVGDFGSGQSLLATEFSDSTGSSVTAAEVRAL